MLRASLFRSNTGNYMDDLQNDKEGLALFFARCQGYLWGTRTKKVLPKMNDKKMRLLSLKSQI